MFSQFLSFALFIQVPCAIFVYVDARRRKMEGFGFWVLGVIIFMPFFLPFYILLRPRRALFACPSCGADNEHSATKCRVCSHEFEASEKTPLKREWNLSDVIAIFALSVFTLPLSLMGFGVVLHLTSRDVTSWVSSFAFNLIGSSLIAGLSVWFIRKVCKRPFSDIGLVRSGLYRNILLGVILVVPVIAAEYALEEAIVRTAVAIAPSHAEEIQKLRAEEESRSLEMWPEKTGYSIELLGSIFLLVLLAPVGEEILFRGLALTALRIRGKWRAIVMTSLLFGLVHVQVIHFLPIILSGLILAYLVERTGSLVPSISLHISHNLVLMILVQYFPNLYS